MGLAVAILAVRGAVKIKKGEKQDSNYGLEGIEARYDSVLSGTAGKTVRATNAYGTELLFNQFEEYRPGEDGYDIVTTIDSTIQYYVEKHLRQAVEDYDIQNGAGAIAMDVNTGKILAMASLGNYDLNDFLAVSEKDREYIDEAETKEEAAERLAAAQAKQWRNKALSDTYEPGSTFKIITLAMALEEGAVSLNDTFYCGGNVSVITAMGGNVIVNVKEARVAISEEMARKIMV